MKQLLVLGLLGVALPAFARTVIWYRMEDGAAGTPTDPAVAVTNSVSADYAATPKTITGTTVDSPASADYLPKFANSAAAGFAVYDPVTGILHPNACGLAYTMTGRGDTHGGFLDAGDSEELRAITNVTFEAFVRIPPQPAITGSWMRPIINKMYQQYQSTWNLAVFESNLFYRVTLLKSGGGTTTHTWGNGAKTRRLDDGKWHHVALTLDFGTKDVGLYVDYIRINTGGSINHTMSSEAIGFYHPATSPLLIGGHNTHTTRRYCGDMDEVRISDEVLTPEQFLRFKPADSVADTNVLLYVRGERDIGWSSMGFDTYNATLSTEYAIGSSGNAGAFPLEAAPEAVPTVKVHQDRFDTPGVTNVASINIRSNVVASATGVSRFCSYITFDDRTKGGMVRSLSKGSFTVECFFKTRGQTVKLGVYDGSHCLFNSNYMKVLINNESGGTLLTRANGISDAYNGKRVDDGNWHHYAFVYDAAERHVYGYLDYVRYADIGLKEGQSLNTANDVLYIGTTSAAYQPFDGWMDEIRITRRALRPFEFVSGHAVGQTLAEATFDDPDAPYALTAEPGLRPVLPSGAPGKLTDDGETASLSDVTPGALVWDGEGGSDIRANSKSVYINGGRVDWPSNDIIVQPDDFTVEFFAKIQDYAHYGNLLRVNRNWDNDNGVLWALFGTWDKADPTQLLANTMLVTNSVAGQSYFYLGDVPKDNRWHHYAFTFLTGGTDAAPTTTITMYRDYVQVARATKDGHFNKTKDSANRLSLAGTGQKAKMQGWFDAIRISSGILPTEKFIRRVRKGMVILFR